MKITRSSLKRTFSFSWRDLLVSAAILLCATGACALLHQTADTIDGFASPVYVLAVLLISRFTSGYLFGLIAAVLGVIGVNYVFTYPYMAFNFTISGYPLTMFTFLVVSLVTSTLTTKTKEQDGQWLIRVVENLLSITRIGNESAKITKEPEAAEEVLDEAVRKFRKRFPAVSVEVHVPDELLLVPMDAILIMQVLSNLMENAVFHGGTTTHIALSAQRDGPWARFYVQDNGQGIPPQKLHTLFSGALRCEDSSPGDGKRNMGLGLSVCMAIIRAHGGTLEAKNLESGAEFSFCLPLTKEEVS